MTGQNDKDMNNEVNEPQLSAADLRNARRKARHMGLNPANGAEAVRMLREKGVVIEPTQTTPQETKPTTDESSASTELVRSNANLPEKQAEKSQLPAVSSKRERQAEIDKLQERMKKRRNQRIRQMIRRFAMYVALPTLATTYYLYNVATPLYSAKTILSIQEGQSSAAGGLGSLFKGSPLGGGNLDAIKVQSYMESRDIFLKLEEDFDFPAVFAGENINRFERLPDDASEEARYKVFTKNAISIYDTTDQVLRLEIKAPDPETAETVAGLMIRYAESQLDNEMVDVRDDEYKSAKEAFDAAEEDLKQSQLTLLNLQKSQTNLSTTAESEVVIGLISEKRIILSTKQTALEELLRNEKPIQARVDALRNDIKALEKNIADLNAQALAENEQGESLATILQKETLAEADVALKAQSLEAQRNLLQAADAKRIETGKYITEAFPPTASFEPIYPKKLTSSLMAFLIFFGLYLFIAMTVDVIREQVSV